ncbi:MAG: DUF1036 domain-containing protein [Hyphomonadaceae bacterium]
MAQEQDTGGWRLCNQTSFVLEASTGRPDGDNVIVEGWTRLRPGECRAVIQAPVKRGIYFVYARSSTAHRGGQRTWPGDVPLCVDPNGRFSVRNPSSCASVGLESRNFRAVRLDRARGDKLTFRETEDYNKPGQSALAAGLQRLLSDAGVESENVDGYIGRRSRAAIAAFLAERKLPPNTPDAKLIDILEDVARNRSLEVGLMLCNRTENRVLAAIARRRPEEWESRGWWTLEAGACARTVDDMLIATPHYVYAEMLSPQGTRKLKGAQTVFCISRSRFAILGRKDCAARRYRQAEFMETPIPEDGKLVFEFFDRSFGAPTESED